jgi:hypothetical protein
VAASIHLSPEYSLALTLLRSVVVDHVQISVTHMLMSDLSSRPDECGQILPPGFGWLWYESRLDLTAIMTTQTLVPEQIIKSTGS